MVATAAAPVPAPVPAAAPVPVAAAPLPAAQPLPDIMDVLSIAPPKPELPGPENKSVDVSGTMQAIIAHNTSHLREKLKSNSNAFFRQFADIPLYEHKPLDITDDNTGTTLTSYKHPWDKEKALSALKTTGCYEVRMLGKT